jgi:Ca2+-binding RTX toxin-like protein
MAEINGTGLDDTLGGTPDADVIDAGPGNDIVIGLPGDDSISGGTGNDLLFGRAGDDILFGTVESLLGNAPVTSGDDVLVGGDGADFFVFDLRDALASNVGNDVIPDFEPGDTIILAGLTQTLDSNGNGLLDGGDARVDVVGPRAAAGAATGSGEVDLRIDLTGALTVTGSTAQGSITVLGVDGGLEINQDVFLQGITGLPVDRDSLA